jgi:hypothetical protein
MSQPLANLSKAERSGARDQTGVGYMAEYERTARVDTFEILVLLRESPCCSRRAISARQYIFRLTWFDFPRVSAGRTGPPLMAR